MSRQRILLADDHALVRAGIRSLLDAIEGVEVVGEAGDGPEALRLAEELKPDVVLLDIALPGLSGLEVAARLTRAGHKGVVLLSMHSSEEHVRQALSIGVAGYVLKDAPVEQLVDTLRRVHSGQRVIAPELAVAAWDADDPLTERERDVLRNAADGSPNAEIAARLHLAEGTVRNYLSSAIAKLGARNRTEAAATARERGWL